MLAIDTNIIVRYLTDDDAQQSAKAKAIIEGDDVFVTTSVLLETGWVLRSLHGLPADRLVKALTGFAGLPTVTLENAAMAAKALVWAQTGTDLADASHLAGAEGCEAFVTFDRDFAKRIRAIGGVKARTP